MPDVTTTPNGPGVRVPPPLIPIEGIVLAWCLDHWVRSFELDAAGVSLAQGLLGVLLIGAGLVAIFWTVRTLLHAHTTFRPDRAATALVTWGPYRWSRNPIYVGFIAIYLGVAALTNLAWQVVLLPLVLLALTVAVIYREEAYLRATFPEYEQYAGRVRRWL